MDSPGTWKHVSELFVVSARRAPDALYNGACGRLNGSGFCVRFDDPRTDA